MNLRMANLSEIEEQNQFEKLRYDIVVAHKRQKKYSQSIWYIFTIIYLTI